MASIKALFGGRSSFPSTNSAGRPSITYTDMFVIERNYIHASNNVINNNNGEKKPTIAGYNSHTIKISRSNKGGSPDNSYTKEFFKLDYTLRNLVCISKQDQYGRKEETE